MALFEHPDFDNHEHVSFCFDKETGLQAIIAIHNTHLGPSLGGCRMWPYSNSEEALSDVLKLSQGMSYKAAMAGLKQGGGKAVIIGDPRKHKSDALMRAMGRFVNNLNGQYIIAEDSGINVEDVQIMGSQTSYAAGASARFSFDNSIANGNPAPSTAYGVFCGIKSATQHVFSSDLRNKTVAIQGLGNVGLRLAKHLYEAGAKLFVSDIYSDNLLVAQNEYEASIVDNESIHMLDVDIFAPCALGGAINEQSIDHIKAKIVAGAANNQLTNNQLAKTLKLNNIAYVPDYVINAGGIIDIYHQSLTNSSNHNLRLQLEDIGNTVQKVLEKSSLSDSSTVDIANEIAEQALLNQSIKE